MNINDKIAEIREDIATSEAALEKANGLLNSKLGHMLADFCGNPNRTKADLKAIKGEIADSGNPYGVRIQIEKERKGGEALIMVDTFYVGFKFNTSFFLYYKMDKPFDLKDDIANEMEFLERKRKELAQELADLKELEDFGEITLDKVIEFLDTHDITESSSIYRGHNLISEIADFAYEKELVTRTVNEWDNYIYSEGSNDILYKFTGKVNGFVVARSEEDAMYRLHKNGVDYHGLKFEIVKSDMVIMSC